MEFQKTRAQTLLLSKIYGRRNLKENLVEVLVLENLFWRMLACEEAWDINFMIGSIQSNLGGAEKTRLRTSRKKEKWSSWVGEVIPYQMRGRTDVESKLIRFCFTQTIRHSTPTCSVSVEWWSKGRRRASCMKCQCSETLKWSSNYAIYHRFDPITGVTPHASAKLCRNHCQFNRLLWPEVIYFCFRVCLLLFIFGSIPNYYNIWFKYF